MVLLYLEVGYARLITLIWDISGFIVPLSGGDDMGSCVYSSVDACNRFVMTIIVKFLPLQYIFKAGYRSQKTLKIHKIFLGSLGYEPCL